MQPLCRYPQLCHIYGDFKTKLADFIQSKFKAQDNLLTSLKYSFAIEYDHYLKSEVNLHQNTLVKYIQYLNKVLDYAVQYECVDKNVLFGHKCSVKETKREYLNADELQSLALKEISIVRIKELRDCLFFCCFIGNSDKGVSNLFR